jgi:CelD/BcsL family acetyltransferase involved in cellulose biosynthesis
VKTLNKIEDQATALNFLAPQASATSAEQAEGLVIEGPWRATPEVLLSVHSDFASLRNAWTALEQTGDCTAFQSHAWLSTWFAHIGKLEGIEPCIVTGWDADEEGALFILPLGIQRGLTGAKLVWLGGGLCDYQGPVLSKAFPHRVRNGQFKALWKQIRQTLPEHDVVELSRMPEKIGGQANPFMQLGRISQHASSAHMTRLKPTWDAYYDDKRSSGSKKRDRQKRRKMEEFGETVLVTPTDKDAIARTVDALIEQKSATFARMGVANMFEKPGVRDFYMALATDAAAEGLIHVAHLEVGGKIAAANWGVSFGGRYHYVLASYAEQEEFAKRGPGMIQLMDLMKHAIEAGHTEFDFTIGDEGYKADWCEVEIKLFDHLEAATVRGLLTLLPTAAFLKVKRFIKQTPVLWQAFTRLRAVAGSLPGVAARA